MGNVVGSNLCNLLLILGISALIKPIRVNKQTKTVELPMLLSITILFMALANIGGSISRIDAVIFLMCFVMFIGYTIVISKKNNEVDKEEEVQKQCENKNSKEKQEQVKSIIYIVLGIIGLKYGGDFIVTNAVFIATKLEVSQKIIGLTIISIGTSLPELVTSIVAAKKGEGDLALGNVIGSNIFNILLILGTTAFIHPIKYLATYNVQMCILICATILICIYPFIGKKEELTRKKAGIFVSMYLVYIITVFMLP